MNVKYDLIYGKVKKDEQGNYKEVRCFACYTLLGRQWIRALAAQGLTPGIQEIASLTGTRSFAETLERQHLYRALAEGATLLNRQYILGDPDSFREFLQGEMREAGQAPSSARSNQHEREETSPHQ